MPIIKCMSIAKQFSLVLVCRNIPFPILFWYCMQAHKSVFIHSLTLECPFLYAICLLSKTRCKSVETILQALLLFLSHFSAYKNIRVRGGCCSGRVDVNNCNLGLLWWMVNWIDNIAWCLNRVYKGSQVSRSRQVRCVHIIHFYVLVTCWYQSPGLSFTNLIPNRRFSGVRRDVFLNGVGWCICF